MPQNPPPIILDLIEHFERNIESYRSPAYNEAQVRQEFINPFFEALGWDVSNKDRHAEAYKDVIHEDAIKVGAPDYCFRIGGARKFFLEAKKPAVNIKDDPDPAYQLRRYAWSAKLPLSILTDFEEFAVYDCRARPSPSDKASAGRIHYLTYKEYATRWDEIASVFSKDAVLKGSFDKYAVSERKRGTTTVDAEFLAEIEKWREDLAKNLAVRNTALDVHELNFAVQRTIDRLIFLRICEDRGIEPYAQLQALLNGENIYGRLRHLYDQADDRYNSGLFHFRSEKERDETPDELTPKLKIDDKILKDIIHGLYYPASPYEFSVMPAEILGQVYEQFLGKVIRLTSGHQAKVEEKPEVKKAGGVYYTPAYIVAYIVRNTVGKLCEGKTPKHISKLKILDPACGSGSFLIGAYDYLVAYHRDWYLKDGAEKHTKELYQGAGGLWHLATQEKKRILLNNIYGVDIDSQAVEVTKLSLLLKVLEGENQETLKKQLKMWHERALPDLGRNIKCGNSLIGPDYYQGQQAAMFDDEETRRVNAFDWKAEFPEIIKAGGFDAVIGNPPYVRIGNIDQLVLPYLYKKYDVAHRFDIYIVFVLKAYELLSAKGRLGFILPNKFFTADYGRSLRAFLASSKAVQKVVDFGDSQVFAGASTYTCLLFLSREPHNSISYLEARADSFAMEIAESSVADVDRAQLGEDSWSFLPSSSAKLLGRFKAFPSLGDLCEIERGLETGCDEVFFLQFSPQGETKSSLLVTSKAVTQPLRIEKAAVRSLVKGSADVRRYFLEDGGRLLVFPYRREDEKPVLIEPTSFANELPLAWKYLNDNSRQLKAREKREWYAFRRRNYDLRDGVARILVPSIGKRLSAAVDPEGHFYFVGSGGGGGGSYGLVVKANTEPSIYYILGLINSKLGDWIAKLTNSRFGGGYYSFNRQYIEPIPIRPIDFTNSIDKTSHDHMVALVERMLDLHKRLANAKAPDDKIKLQRQIDATDKEIDHLVYDLYGLTEEEIGVVEGTTVASRGTECENTDYEDSSSPSRHEKAGRQAASVAKTARRSGKKGDPIPPEDSGLGGTIHGVRERTGEYGPPEDSSERAEGTAGQLGSTRDFETSEGTLSYTQVSERLAVALTGILKRIIETPPESLLITPEWLCSQHRDLAGGLFPQWAGRYRDREVQIGGHTPPPLYEVPVLVRLFCDDLAERLRHLGAGTLGGIADVLAWADWRFQWIHPFRDFNGRIGRVLLVALIHRTGLPPMDTVQTEPNARRQYLHALQAADNGDLGPLTDIWARRIAETL